MHPPVVTRDPTAVAVEVQALYLSIFPDGDRLFISRAFSWAVDSFGGRRPGYQAVDVPYHDLEHTLQGILCMTRLLRGRHEAGAVPGLTEEAGQLGLLAMLLHDTGYLKKRFDTEGTGAKYTVTHVDRSASFAAELLTEKGYTSQQVKAVQNMIHCTGVDTNLGVIPFQNELEKTLGFALGTADLLGQMSAEDYVEKLPALYAEFAEAAGHLQNKSHVIARYSSSEDLRRRTPDFWEKFVKPKLDDEFGGLHRFLNDPYPNGANPYFQRIESNMQRLRRQLAVTES
jgi:hypothetical protein